jgi:hypothetical protein
MYPDPETHDASTKIEISADAWSEVTATATRLYIEGTERELAFWDALHMVVDEDVTVTVDGEPKGPADIPALNPDE